MISGSNAGDVAACPAREAFPQVRTSGAAAERGVVLHKFAELCTLHPEKREEYLLDVPEEWRHTAKGMDLHAAHEGLEGTVRRLCEVSYVVNVKERTARCLGVNKSRQYGDLGPYELPLTIDLEDTVLGSVPCEQDYKSGRYCGDPYEQFQRKLSAAALMFAHDTSQAVSRVCYIWDDGTTKLDGCEFTIIDAWEACDVMVEAFDRVEAVKVQLKNGEIPTVYPDAERQCKYCSAFTVCPAWNNLLKGAGDKLKSAPDFTEVDAIEKGYWMDYVKGVLKVASAMEETLKEHAKREALIVNQDWEYSVGVKNGRTSFDAPAARGLILVLASKAGMTQEETEAALAKLNKKSGLIEEIRKRKRVA